ncbi:hypothetical protein [Streptomyces sp. NPDC048419]|uniref:hypothetical protein n=1 Tax=Streptomyces sp. NPDC048419 TaxID=3365547 RepID=UPI0037198EFF
MIAQGDGDELLAGVRRALERAGFDSAPDAGGLRLRRRTDAVVVAWEPGAGLGAAGQPGHEAMRTALLHALLAVLGQAGYAVQAGGETGEVQVRCAAP